ncbi:hypothetical protein NQ318_001364 [Aromia moschata]|uniref:Ribosomal protein L5 n=1 Tax=Aromia moschata TaxID=1265417 RepID=A0AAV8YVP8_9CUCU|nr:hypothetical protein NQ318_001364 [Aromia moschata]
MQRSLEQRMAIKFCVKLEKSAAETIPMLKKAFGVDCLSDRQIFRGTRLRGGSGRCQRREPRRTALNPGFRGHVGGLGGPVGPGRGPLVSFNLENTYVIPRRSLFEIWVSEPEKGKRYMKMYSYIFNYFNLATPDANLEDVLMKKNRYIAINCLKEGQNVIEIRRSF